MSATARIDDLLELDSLLTPEDIELRQTVRRFGEQRLRPHIAEWFEAGEVPARELAPGGSARWACWGCTSRATTARARAQRPTGWPARTRGRRLRLRRLVSVQGSLAMFAIHTTAAKSKSKSGFRGWRRGEASAASGSPTRLGSDPGAMRTRAKRDGTDWILDGTKMWITNGSVADVAVVWARSEDGVLGFVVPTDTPGSRAPESRARCRCGRRLPPSSCSTTSGCPPPRCYPGPWLVRPLSCLNEARFGIIFGRSARPATASRLRSPTPRARALRQVPGGLPAHPGQARRHGGRTRQGDAARDASRPAQGRAALRPEQVAGKLNNVREAIKIAREAGPSSAQPASPWSTRDASRQQPRVGADLRGHLRGAPAGHRPGVDR